MKVSVEISTHNRKETLLSVLRHLSAQTYPTSDFEVVISDDGSTDGLLDDVANLAPTLPYTLRTLSHQRGTVGRTHNEGLRACRGDLVFMLAADIFPAPRWMEEHIIAHRNHPEPTAVVVGRILQSDEVSDSPFQRAFDGIVANVLANRNSIVQVGNFLVSNISFKREFLQQSELFREWPLGANEDIEFGYRLAEQGMRLIECPEALGYHYHPVTMEGVALRSYLSGYHSHYLESQFPDLRFRKTLGNVTPRDGIGVFLRARMHNLMRTCLVNRFTVPTLVEPLLRKGESGRWLQPLLPMLCRRMITYHYYRGVRDYRRNLPCSPPSAPIYPSKAEVSLSAKSA